MLANLSPEAAREQRMGKAKILIVEDDAIIVLRLKETLQSLNYDVVSTADTGEQAVKKALSFNPDLVLMDITLKGSMDGIQATQEIHAQLDIPVIFMTAFSDESKIKRAKETRPYGYLLKPVQDKELEVNIAIALHIAQVEAEKKQVEEEKKKLEQQFFQIQKMESLGTLAGGIAHDFNNLLFQIMGSVQIVKKRLPETDRSARNLSNALQAAFRAKDLVQQILTFSRSTNSEYKAVKVQPILKEAVKLLRSSLPSTIQIIPEINLEAGAIECDPTQIYQVLVNLCTNAHSAMQEKGGILTVIIRESTDQKRLEMIVGDTGCGIAPDILDKIYDPYFTTREKGEGTGLGLSNVHGIVKSHLGTISVTSTVGQGTTFHLSFPLAKPSGNNPDFYASSPDLPLGTEQILVVDDEELISRMEVEILQSLGYRVDGFHSSLEAFEAYKKDPHKYDLVLSDQTMPNLTGTDLAQKILKLRADARIVILTGYSKNISKTEVEKAGIKRLILKPLDMEMLATAVREVLDAT